MVGLPIAFAGVVIGSFEARRLAISAAPASSAELIRAVLAILAVPTCAVVLRVVFGLSMTLAIAASAVVVAALPARCPCGVTPAPPPEHAESMTGDKDDRHETGRCDYDSLRGKC